MSAGRAAELIGERYAQVESDAIQLSDNEETQQLFARLATGDSSRIAPALAAADTFLKTKWAQSGSAYHAIELRDTSGRILLAVAAEPDSAAVPRDDSLPPIIQPIVLDHAGRRVGDVVLHPLVSTILPGQLAGLTSGPTGYLLLVDSAVHMVIYDSRGARRGGIASAVLGDAAVTAIAQPWPDSQRIEYGDGDSTRLASAVRIGGLGWTVISSSAISEFTAGLDRARFRDLALVFALAIAVAIAFTILIGRTTRTLEELRSAASAVGRGDLSPPLPPATDDEVGTLSGAFDKMLGRIRTMLNEIEISRQLAVLGEFSAQLSHEVRNPLTSLKLNLQGLARDVRRGKLPEEAGAPVETCLREVNRLDGVVRGVLELARPRNSVRAPCDIHQVLDRVVEVHAVWLDATGIAVTREYGAAVSAVNGDADQLVGLLTNLVVNAIDAQPNGGRLLLRTTDCRHEISMIVADDGPGAPVDLAERIFRPFVSGKPMGTGLGLPMALNVARDHGGTLELIGPVTGFSGAAFRVKLPRA